MRRALLAHPRFLGHVPPPRPLAGEAVVIAAAVEALRWVVGERTIVHALVRNGDELHPLMFVEIRDDAILIPRAHEGRVATRNILDALEPWLDRIGTALGVYAFTPDDGIQRCLDAGGAALVPVFGGSSAAFDAVDRYRFAARYAADRRVVDLSDGTGYGLQVFAPVVAAVAFEPPGTWAPLAARFGFVAPRDAVPQPDFAFALALQPASVGERLERLRARVDGRGGVFVSALGAEGAEAIRTAGLEPQALTRPGGDGLAALDEWYAVQMAPSRAVPVEREPEDGATSTPAAIVSERPLRVVFVVRESAQQLFGGDVVQVRETAAALRRRGHHVDVAYGMAFETDGYDVVHLTNITVAVETLAQAERAETHAGAVVLMPIFSDHGDEALWGWRGASQIFNGFMDVPQFDNLIGAIATRGLSFTIEGQSLTANARLDMHPGYTEQQRNILRRCDFLVANAHAEMHRVYRYLEPGVPYAVAPSAVDANIYRPEAAAAFRERYAIDDFVLLPGRIEERKNQFLFCEAMRRAGRRVVLIGRCYTPYEALPFMAHLPPNAIAIPAVSEPELAAAMAAARVVALPSWDEVVSLSSLNAAACGTSMVLTRNSYEHEYFRDDAEYIDPASVEDIIRGVEAAWASHDRRRARRAELVRRVRREYTWDRAAEATEAAYYRVLADNPRGDARRAAAARR